MYRNINLKRDCVKKGGSIYKLNENIKYKKSSPTIVIEEKIKNIDFKKIKPLKMKI